MRSKILRGLIIFSVGMVTVWIAGYFLLKKSSHWPEIEEAIISNDKVVAVVGRDAEMDVMFLRYQYSFGGRGGYAKFRARLEGSSGVGVFDFELERIHGTWILIKQSEVKK